MDTYLAFLPSRLRVWLKEFGKFGLVGVSNTVVDFAVYLGLTRSTAYFHEHFLQANLLAFLIANLNSFLLNRRFTFSKSGAGATRYPMFLTVSAVYLGVIQLGMWSLVSYAGLYDMVAKVLVVGCATVVYFVVLRTWVFPQRFVTTDEQASALPLN